MTSDVIRALVDLTPANGRETTATRRLDSDGDQLDPDQIHKYIRVIGSKLTNLEPHFWGDGFAIAKSPSARKQPDHYYVTQGLRRIEITVQKRSKAETRKVRQYEFDTVSGIGAYLRPGRITPWREIPEQFGRRRYLMFLAQEHPDQLLEVGYQPDAIDACAHGQGLPAPTLPDGSPRTRNGKTIRFEVHHRIPLQAGGSNAIENLCLVDKDVHNPFFHKGDDPTLNRMSEGEVRTVALTIPRDDIQVIAVGLNVEVHLEAAASDGGRYA